MATPFLSILRRQNPDDIITVLCREYVSALLDRSSFIDRLAAYPRDGGITGALRALAAGRPERGWDAAFILPMSFSSALIAFFSRARRRIGYRSGGRGWLLKGGMAADDRRRIHLSLEYARLAGSFTGSTDEEPLPLPCVVPPYDWKDRAAASGASGRYAVYAPGAKYGPAKVWPADRYAGLAERLHREQGLAPVFTGAEAERASIECIAGKVGGLNLVGRSGIEDMMSVLRGAVIVVGNDSGPVHVSAAMGVPTVAVFGSTSPAWTAPRGRLAKVVASTAECAPCFRKECPAGDYHCLAEIAVDRVYEEAVMMIKESAQL
jgi:heptosyltransferase-2